MTSNDSPIPRLRVANTLQLLAEAHLHIPSTCAALQIPFDKRNDTCKNCGLALGLYVTDLLMMRVTQERGFCQIACHERHSTWDS